MASTMLIVGLCIDVSHLYMAKIELQDAADAAAVADASQLNSSSGGIKLAVSEATRVLNKYDIKKDVMIPKSAISFSVNLNGPYMSQADAEENAANIRFVKVTIPPKPVGMTLSSIVIGDTQNLGASTVAGMSVALTMNKFYSAFMFVEPGSNVTSVANSGNQNDQVQTVVADEAQAGDSSKVKDENAADNNNGTGNDNGSGSQSGFQLGQTYLLLPKKWQSNEPNSYRVLSGTGGDLILTGTIHAYGYADSKYQVAKLNENDALRLARIGVNTRFGDYSLHPAANATDEPPDTIVSQNISYATYTQMQGDGVVQRGDGVRNRRVITLPIATDINYDGTNGQATANRIAAFFLKKKMDVGGTLEVEYISNHITVPVGEYRPGDIQLKELSVPIIYR